MNTDSSVYCESCGASIQAESTEQILAICGTCGSQIIVETGQLLPRNAVLIQDGKFIRLPAHGGKWTIVPLEHIKIFMDLGLANKI